MNDVFLPEDCDAESSNGAVEDADVDEVLEREAGRSAEAAEADRSRGQITQNDNLGAEEEANNFVYKIIMTQ